MYYVSTKGGGGGSAKCLLLLTWGEGGVKAFAYVIIFSNLFLQICGKDINQSISNQSPNFFSK